MKFGRVPEGSQITVVALVECCPRLKTVSRISSRQTTAMKADLKPMWPPGADVSVSLLAQKHAWRPIMSSM